jgi:hypothetical protein
MTSTNPGSRVGGYRREIDYQKLGPALLIFSRYTAHGYTDHTKWLERLEQL